MPSQNISAANTFTNPVIKADDQPLSVSLSGNWVGTVTVQRSRDGNTWFDVDRMTANFEKDGRVAGDWHYRAGFKTGEYTSGTASIGIY